MTKSMSRNQIIIRPVGSSIYRRQPLLESSSRGRIAEVAGGTAAECVAVWCCCPCTVINLAVLAVYKLPAGICRKALKIRKRRRMLKKGLIPLSSSSSASTSTTSSSRQSLCQCSAGTSFGGWEGDEFHMADCEEVSVVVLGKNDVDMELMALEEEMWSKFYSNGFWRSPSQRD